MLRLTELKLPLDHPPEALREAITQRLGILEAELLDFSIFKRSYDAHKLNALLKKLRDDRNVVSTPDTSYHFVGHAPAKLGARPVVLVSASSGSLLRWCWHIWVFVLLCWSAARPCTSALRTPGGCGTLRAADAPR